ncbi:MAG: sulfatase-like hydrolase/transferase [Planctomycetaceae bacterium]|nr:sulfatase-like hydrolase/transferase [Planctomycetaceae bacterium]
MRIRAYNKAARARRLRPGPRGYHPPMRAPTSAGSPTPGGGPRPAAGRRLAAAGALLPAVGALLACGPGPRERPNLALVIVDTLRADALSSYGNPRPTTPHLDRLAQGGVLFERIYAQAPNTATSHATLFTGLEPWVHRVANMTSLEHGTPGLDPRFATLAERLGAAGFRTGAFTDDGPLGKGWGLMRGYQTLEAKLEGVEAKAAQSLAWLDRAEDPEQPFFLTLHTYETHQPFVPPEHWIERFDPGYEGPLRERLAELRALEARGERPNDGLVLLADWKRLSARDFEHLRALYDAEVAHTDEVLGRWFEELAARGLFDSMALAVTSDHGEEFGEHGQYGHLQLHDETLHVPLILKLPGGAHAGRRIGARLALADLHPTLLELADLGPPREARATSLLGPLADGRWPERPVLAQTTEHLYPPLQGKPALSAIRTERYALLVQRSSAPGAPGSGSPEAELYDLHADPGELAAVARRGAEEPAGSTADAARLGTLLARLEGELQGLERAQARILGGAARGLMPGSKELEHLHAALGYGRGAGER